MRTESTLHRNNSGDKGKPRSAVPTSRKDKALLVGSQLLIQQDLGKRNDDGCAELVGPLGRFGAVERNGRIDNHHIVACNQLIQLI